MSPNGLNFDLSYRIQIESDIFVFVVIITTTNIVIKYHKLISECEYKYSVLNTRDKNLYTLFYSNSSLI